MHYGWKTPRRDSPDNIARSTRNWLKMLQSKRTTPLLAVLGAVALMTVSAPAFAQNTDTSTAAASAGTVYGIMNSFIGIAKTNTTNLAVVAPGIAEALLATGIGLFAAIPSVIFYNFFQTQIAGYGTRTEGFIVELMNAISRQLDRGA